MAKKHVLVVDDDPDMLFLIAHAIKKLGSDYQVSTASNAANALEQVRKQAYDLVVTDYMMPEMTGVELVPEIRRFAPEMQFVIVTAHHDTNRIRHRIDDLNISGFVGKPFMLADLLDKVQRTLAQTERSRLPAMSQAFSAREDIKRKLHELYQQTNAGTVLLANASGTPVLALGDKDPDQISRLAAFVSTNFLSIAELASFFGDDNSTFKSSYYEGNNYNIHAYQINKNFFLIVVVGAEVKPGTIWFFTKQIASDLSDLLPDLHETSARETSEKEEEDIDMAGDFENLLGNTVSTDG